MQFVQQEARLLLDVNNGAESGDGKSVDFVRSPNAKPYSFIVDYQRIGSEQTDSTFQMLRNARFSLTNRATSGHSLRISLASARLSNWSFRNELILNECEEGLLLS